MPPTHPGEILREEFLEPMGITEYRLAKDLGIPQTRVSAITHGRRGITADTGLRLSRYSSTSEGFWDRAAGRVPLARCGGADLLAGRPTLTDDRTPVRPLSA
ncbi:HigA family addiction module antitoxin [Saccharopolyspora hattusasensis]|uniref:HigA family addiction module antitoxin n=1 Tax=Saccharopolyspora hattusasensis TaxID=1128679 RepID=UPI003D967323